MSDSSSTVLWVELNGLEGGVELVEFPYVVDLTGACDDLAALVPGSAESAPNVREIEKEHRTLRFNPVTTEAAADLLID